jgi:hypothetical protein
MKQHVLCLFLTSFLLTSVLGCGTTSDESGISKTFVVDPPAQNSPLPDSLTVIPGPEYKASWLHETFFGEHYRDLWTTPTKVKVLDLATFGGGLLPVKQTGGFQTKSLRLQGEDGKQYAFRSVHKDPKAVLPLELQDTFAADVLQDQISSSNPASALVVDVFADALGVLHPKPQLVLLPDDERLGQFREMFAGILGIIEDYPAAGPEGKTGFGGSDKIVGTTKLYETLENDNDHQINAKAMLTARLLDVFVGDWDRHIDQWRWARYKENGRNIWYPIPRDRDQAFARFDGLFPTIGAAAITQFEDFSDNFYDMTSLTFQGRFVDRRLLVSLDKQTWDSAASVVVSKLTDDVIERAVRNLPPEYYQIKGDWLAKALKSRRNNLKRAADEYYSLLCDYVDVRLSDKPELVEVKRLDDERVEVVAYRREKKSGEVGEEVFHRVFLCNETNEIRLYLHGGDDKCVVSGDVASSIVVRVVGGGGDDELIDDSYVHGILWGFIPFIPQAETRTYFYDDKGENKFVAGVSCKVDKKNYEAPQAGLVQY